MLELSGINAHNVDSQCSRVNAGGCAVIGADEPFGARGSDAFAGGRIYDETSRLEEKIADTAGCGDSFIGRFS